ncbi:hypothetical protein SNE40_016523 [Patella caerulea]|uniref:Uncharacterized protein n=1 Tax=Patella caerulea TaxID=87958 RepID=A0AAN8PCC1_PATCE
MDAFTAIKKWFEIKLDGSPLQQILSARRLREHQRKYHIHGGNVLTPDTVPEFVVPTRHVADRSIKTDIDHVMKNKSQNMQTGSMTKAKQIFGDHSLYFDDLQFARDSYAETPDNYNSVSTSSSSAASSIDVHVRKRSFSDSSNNTSCQQYVTRRRTRSNGSSIKSRGRRLGLSSLDGAMITTGPKQQQNRLNRSYSCGKDCKRISKNVIRHSSPPTELDLNLFVNTNSDPQSAAAMSLEYLATKTCYGFATLKEPPTYGRRESLFYSYESLLSEGPNEDKCELKIKDVQDM